MTLFIAIMISIIIITNGVMLLLMEMKTVVKVSAFHVKMYVLRYFPNINTRLRTLLHM